MNLPRNARKATALILSGDAKHRVSKDGPEGDGVRAHWSVLREASRSGDAPQDDGGRGVRSNGARVEC